MPPFQAAHYNHLEFRRAILKSVVRQTFSALKNQPVFFFGLAFLQILPGGLPILVLHILPSKIASPMTVVEIITLFSVIFLILWLWALACQGAYAYGVCRFIKDGEPPDLGKALGLGLKRLPSLIWPTFLLCLATGATGFIVEFVGFLYTNGFLGLTVLFILLYPLVAILFLLLLLFCIYGLYIPACVIEGRSGMDSLKRSQTLTKNHRLTIMGLLIAIGLGGLLLWIAVIVAVSKLAFGLPLSTQALPYFVIMGLIFACPVSAFYSVTLTVTFLEFRYIHEGPALEHPVGP